MRQAAFLLLFISFYSLSEAQTSFAEKTTSASNVRLNVSNVGTVGNAFRGYRDGSGRQSCEYPAGSGIEHLFEGGIWIGGLIDGNLVAVSTSAYDAPSGYATGRGGFEFTAEVGSTLNERSTLIDNPNYSPSAISHQDFVSVYSDKNLIVPGTSIPISGHTQPMFVKVTQETLNWNYSFSDFFVILNYTIENTGSSRIDSVFFGLWNNTVVRNVNITPAGSGGSAFYNKGGNGYLDSQLMAYCFDAAGDLGFTESYIGQKFLGAEDKYGFHHPFIDGTFKDHYNAWEFNNTTNPVFFLPSTEQGRYIKLTQGLNQDKCWTRNATQNPDCGALSYKDQLKAAGNRSDLVSVGPFRNFLPGDKITVTYALVLAKKLEDGQPNAEDNPAQQTLLKANARWAQTAFNGEDKNFNGKLDDGEDADGNGKITRFILPTPPDIPKTRVVTGEKTIDVYWSNNAENTVDPITRLKDFEGYRVYLTKLGFDVTQTPNLQKDLIKTADFDLPGNNLFYETGFDKIKLASPLKLDGDTTTYHYRYSIDKVLNGWQYAVAVTAYDRGNPENNLESLESSALGNTIRAFPGKPANGSLKTHEPFAYPNPYYAGASWEGKSNFQEQSRKIYFANLPARCKIRIYTVAGDFIDELEHNQAYNGSDIRWYQTFGSEDPSKNTFSGGKHAWDMLSQQTQIISRGLYIFTVQDLDSGQLYKGNFTIVK